ncbi:MAG: hypothetical protein ACYCU3_16765, partial [Streptosporangiaceae bacterium]
MTRMGADRRFRAPPFRQVQHGHEHQVSFAQHPDRLDGHQFHIARADTDPYQRFPLRRLARARALRRLARARALRRLA